MSNVVGGNVVGGTSVSMIFFGPASSTAAGATTYIAPNASFDGGSESVVSRPMSAPCTISNLRIKVQGAPVGAETFTYTLFKNGSATALTVTLTGSAVTGSDLAHSIEYAAGDTMSLRLVTSASAAVVYHTACIFCRTH